MLGQNFLLSIAKKVKNAIEIDEAVRLANQYPDIVKVIAVGNEAMVKWAELLVQPSTILKWVNYFKKSRANYLKTYG
jgi:hypothetical protein